MKKSVVLVGAALLTVSGLATADGFYMGAGVGALQLNNTFAFSETQTDTPDINLSQTGHGTSVNGTVLVGYAWENPNDYFIGLEAFQNMSDAQASATLSDQYGSENLHLKIKDIYGIRLLPGYHLTPDTVAYGIVGLAHSKMELSNDNGVATDDDVNGYQLGTGMMTKITPNVALRGDLIYTGYGKAERNRTESSSYNDGSSSYSYSLADSSSIKPSTMEGNVDLMYSFG